MMKCPLKEFLEVYDRLKSDPDFDPNSLPLHMRRAYWALRSDRRTEVVNEFVKSPRTAEAANATG